MRKLAVLALAVVCLGGLGFAGPFVGVEIVPTGNSQGPAASANFAVGWDSGSWIKTAFLFSNPFFLDGSYGISFSPLWSITPSWRIGGAAHFGFQVEQLQFVTACWAVGFETVAKWEGVLAWVRLTFPMDIYSDLPLGGALLTVGVAFDFFPRCVSPWPGCPDSLGQ